MKIDPEIFGIVMIIYFRGPERNLINTQLPPCKINRMIKILLEQRRAIKLFDHSDFNESSATANNHKFWMILGNSCHKPIFQSFPVQIHIGKSFESAWQPIHFTMQSASLFCGKGFHEWVKPETAVCGQNRIILLHMNNCSCEEMF